MTMSVKDRRLITQKVGAIVRLEGLTGVVTGHYDDDIVFVQLEGEITITRAWVEALSVVVAS